ncbi:MAG: ATP-binding cassette domain-containing protein [Bacteriovoracaceae bacterium]|nr:ATP-binding cassette domain-containing protein [Bacteriovoracaceae bacterium]
MGMIQVQNLHKTFKVSTKEPGLMGSIKGLVSRKYITKTALKNVSLEIKQGEMVGLIGANGAGKTTLVKVLAGIIHPTDGKVDVLGFNPWDRSDKLRSQMALIMGQKAQLWYDLPALDSYMLLKEIYQIPDVLYKQQIEFLADVLQIKDQLKVQVRKLSLGERMKVELMGALLHRPNVVYLDEPTIGLDLMAQKAVRQFLKDYQKEFKPIILLTSHYMEDIKELCPRVILIKSGELIYDGALQTIQTQFGERKKLVLTFEDKLTAPPQIPSELGTLEVQDNKLSLTTTRQKLNPAMDFLLKNFQPQDVTIQDPPIEEVIESFLRKGRS